MKIELNQEQAYLVLESLDALSENACEERKATHDPEISDSCYQKMKEASELYDIIVQQVQEETK